MTKLAMLAQYIYWISFMNNKEYTQHQPPAIQSILDSVKRIALQTTSTSSSFLVAYSGGVDSSVLLHALYTVKKQNTTNFAIKAIHIHHGLSAHADQWVTHCQQQCQSWQIPLSVHYVTLDIQLGNIENQARNARYDVIKKHLQPNDILCTAQHLDDQCETFFLALKRGSGPTGLSSMAQKTDFYDNMLIRPLLNISRADIEQYAQYYQLNWVEDESNQDDHYDRNFLRLKVLPMINARWPHFSQMVARSAELCQQQQQLIDDLLSDEFRMMLDKQGAIDVVSLSNCQDYKRNALLRMWFKQHHCMMPSRQQLTIIWQTVACAQDDANPKFSFNDKQIRRYKDKLYLLPHYAQTQSMILAWDIQDPLILPDHIGTLKTEYNSSGLIRRPTSTEVVTIRFYAQGMIKIVGRSGSRTIKKIWQEKHIPSWMRTRIPLIYYDDQLITAVGVFVTEQGQGNELNITLVD